MKGQIEMEVVIDEKIAAMELRPLFSKPKTKTRTLDDVIDEMLYCKNCGAYICYPTEHNAKDE